MRTKKNKQTTKATRKPPQAQPDIIPPHTEQPLTLQVPDPLEVLFEAEQCFLDCSGWRRHPDFKANGLRIAPNFNHPNAIRPHINGVFPGDRLTHGAALATEKAWREIIRLASS